MLRRFFIILDFEKMDKLGSPLPMAVTPIIADGGHDWISPEALPLK